MLSKRLPSHEFLLHSNLQLPKIERQVWYAIKGKEFNVDIAHKHSGKLCRGFDLVLCDDLGRVDGAWWRRYCIPIADPLC